MRGVLPVHRSDEGCSATQHMKTFYDAINLCLCIVPLLYADIGIAANSNCTISEIVFFGLRPVTELQNTKCSPETTKCIQAYLKSVPAKSILREKKRKCHAK